MRIKGIGTCAGVTEVSPSLLLGFGERRLAGGSDNIAPEFAFGLDTITLADSELNGNVDKVVVH